MEARTQDVLACPVVSGTGVLVADSLSPVVQYLVKVLFGSSLAAQTGGSAVYDPLLLQKTTATVYNQFKNNGLTFCNVVPVHQD